MEGKNNGLSRQVEKVMIIGICTNGICIGEYLVIAYYQDIKDYQIEQTCMQYCIENGVRLEWLKNMGFEIIDEQGNCKHLASFGNGLHPSWNFPNNKIVTFDFYMNSCISELKHRYLNHFTYHKLIAAIYAHDIKIIE